MLEKKLTPHDIGMSLTKNSNEYEKWTKDLDKFLSLIDEFWESAGEIAQMHIDDMHGNVKGVFGGDLFASHGENIASKCGIYTDTIVFPDPFLRIKYIFEQNNKEDQTYYLIKHGLNILQYKLLACADIKTPIVAILPDLSILENNEQKLFFQLGQKDSLWHSEKLFGRKIKSAEELFEFFQTLDTIEKAVAEIKKWQQDAIWHDMERRYPY